ncbi:MAG: glycosyltransferase [Dysgonamonadaceae bacterium]|jgi:glycosyltransferase involved in cell wall biosynthesis|nr:glycosyltransferase [Dysgonamonadaceae bacterium]
MINPLVSIITVTYNARSLLEQTMQSVFSQTYPNIEYIIIDGASIDGTVTVIKKYESKLSFWISEKDNGIYDAMNKGIRLAKGELIGMINAGDYYEPEAVKSVVKVYSENKDTGIFHGNMNMLNEDGTFFKLKKPNTDLSELYKGISLFHPTFFVTSAVYKKIGLYDARFKISADFDFALRCYRAKVKFFYMDQVITNFRLGGLSSSGNSKGMYESRDILFKNGYKTKVVNPVFHEWQKTKRKKKLFDAVYKLLKKILPLSVLNKLASYISLK